MSATIFLQSTGAFGVKFYNPKTKKQKTVKTFIHKNEADNFAHEIELEFYRKNTIYLPSCVCVAKTLFVLKINSTTQSKGNHILQVGSCRRLRDIIKIRQSIILSLTK